MSMAKFKVNLRFINRINNEISIHCDSLSEVCEKTAEMMRTRNSDAELQIQYCNSDGVLHATAKQNGFFLFG